jgi:phospholipid/cholesterol/gamma-HCH transport system substrate-binding protein
MKKTFSRMRVGLLIFLGAITFVVGILLVGEKSQFFSRTFYVQVNFPAAEGVKPGNIVVMSGYNVGTVVDIELSTNADSVRLLLRINEDVHRFIKPDSKAEIKQEGLVGNKIINLLPGSKDVASVGSLDFIQGVPPFALTSLADNVTSITDTTLVVTNQLKRLLVSLNRGEGTIGRLLTDETLYRNLTDITAKTDSGMAIAIKQIVKLSELLTRVTRTVDALAVRADTSVQNINGMTREMAELARNVNGGKGTVGALLTDRRMYDSLLTLISSLTDVSIDAGNAAGQTAESIRALRQHWLFGRLFGGDSLDKEPAPESAYRRQMKELKRRSAELDRREQQVRELEQKIGTSPK